jgi:hypothetical protein
MSDSQYQIANFQVVDLTPFTLHLIPYTLYLIPYPYTLPLYLQPHPPYHTLPLVYKYFLLTIYFIVIILICLINRLYLSSTTPRVYGWFYFTFER